MINLIEIQDLPHQSFSVLLNEQECDITLRQMGSRIYATLSVEDELIFENVICGNACPLNGFEVLNFSGVLFFLDQNGSDAPQWEGLGSRWKLYYATQDEQIYEDLLGEQALHK